MRPYTDADDATVLYERGVALHDRGEYTAPKELWFKAADARHGGARRNLDELAKRAPQELANPKGCSRPARPSAPNLRWSIS